MNITVNEAVVKEIYSNKLSYELEDYLNAAIDEELEKDDMDTDFIDSCIDAIDELRNGDVGTAVKILLTEKTVVQYCKKQTGRKNTAVKRAVAACIIVAMCSSAIMLNTNTALANQVKEIFSQIISALNITAQESETQSTTQISSIYGAFPKNYSFNVKSMEDIDLDSIRICAVYQDGSSRTVPLSECTVNQTAGFNGDSNKILVVIAYEGCAFSVVYTVENQE